MPGQNPLLQILEEALRDEREGDLLEDEQRSAESRRRVAVPARRAELLRN